MTYNGLESCIINNQSYENESRTSRGDGCASDSLDDDFSSCSSSKDAFGSFSSKWMKRDEQGSDEWELSESPEHFYVKEKPAYSIQSSDVETMKENFAKLLLGEDITGGRKGVSTALALSNAITNLAASIFGELWKLEPLAEERKNKWRREMDWLLSPTNYMVELVPAKQNGANGRTMEIMTPKARADIHMNLPALQKLDSMLIVGNLFTLPNNLYTLMNTSPTFTRLNFVNCQETLESMVNAQFYYAEVGSRAEGRNKSARESKRWWLPLPQVPKTGLSDTERQKLQCKGKVVYQVFKAAASINENVLLEIPLPSIIRDALPKSGKASLGDDLYKVLTLESTSVDEMFISLNLKSENNALEVINRADLQNKLVVNRQCENHGPLLNPISEMDKMELLVDRAEALLHQIKSAYPNLPQTFLDASKIQYGKDVGHSILEAYSRVLKNLAFSIMCRMGEILQEDCLCNPNSGVATWCFPGINVGNPRHSHSLSDVMSKVEGSTANPIRMGSCTVMQV
ncbi:hypothetical protein GOBAR_DD31545 [Gossypium barbadense]|nr:hypothetical protein GOBAR_DD31545 [Gossypium barbadense]